MFEQLLNPLVKAAFRIICHNFLGNSKSEGYRYMVASLLKFYQGVHYNISIKFTFSFLLANFNNEKNTKTDPT